MLAESFWVLEVYFLTLSQVQEVCSWFKKNKKQKNKNKKKKKPLTEEWTVQASFHLQPPPVLSCAWWDQMLLSFTTTNFQNTVLWSGSFTCQNSWLNPRFLKFSLFFPLRIVYTHPTQGKAEPGLSCLRIQGLHILSWPPVPSKSSDGSGGQSWSCDLTGKNGLLFSTAMCKTLGTVPGWPRLGGAPTPWASHRVWGGEWVRVPLFRRNLLSGANLSSEGSVHTRTRQGGISSTRQVL